MDPEKYPFSIEDFRKTVILSNWNFHMIGKEMLMFFVYGTTSKNVVNKYFDKFESKENLSLNIERVKVAKTLRKVYEKKLDE